MECKILPKELKRSHMLGLILGSFIPIELDYRIFMDVSFPQIEPP